MFVEDERLFERWDEDFVKLLKHEFMRFKNAVVLWTMHPWERDARLIKEALKKGPQSYGVIVEIACTRTAEELLGARKAYHSLFDHSVEEDVASNVHGPPRKLLVALVSAYRYEGPKVKDDAVKSDAKILSRVHKNNPLEDDEVIRILATRSKLHLNKLYSHYSQILEDFSNVSVLSETILCLLAPHIYFAKVLNASLDDQADKTTKKALTRVLVTRADIDINEINQEFYKQHGVSLSTKIEERAKGNYKDLLLTLVAKGH